MVTIYVFINNAIRLLLKYFVFVFLVYLNTSCSNSHVLIREYDVILKEYEDKNDTLLWYCEFEFKLENEYVGLESLSKKEVRRIRKKINGYCDSSVGYIVGSLSDPFVYDSTYGDSKTIVVVCSNFFIRNKESKHERVIYDP